MKIWKQTGWLVFVFFTVILAYQWHAAGKGGAKPEQELQITIEAERQIAVVTYHYPVLAPGVYESISLLVQGTYPVHTKKMDAVWWMVNS